MSIENETHRYPSHIGPVTYIVTAIGQGIDKVRTYFAMPGPSDEFMEHYYRSDTGNNRSPARPLIRMIIQTRENLRKLSGFLDSSLLEETASAQEREMLIHRINDDSDRNLIGRF